MVFTLHDYVLPFLWGLVLLASWIGWGGLIRRLFAPPRDRIDWGAQAAWGLAATLILAGFLQPLRLCTTPMLGAIAIAGLALSVGQFLLKLRPPFARKRLRTLLRPRRIGVLIPVSLLLAFFYATSIQTRSADPWDDWSAYLVMAKRIAQTGTLLDPYSVRRILTFGGQQVLDVQLLFAGTFLNIDILENGLAKIIFAGLLWGFFPKTTGLRRGLAALVLLVLLLIPVPHANINSELTGSVLFLALLRTFHLRPHGNPLSRAILIGLIAAAFATLRMNYVPTACLASGLTYAAFFVFPPRRPHTGKPPRSIYLRQFALSLAALILFLIPWSVVLHQSSGTYLYPLFRGTQRPDYDYLNAHLSPAQTIHWIARFLAIPGIPPPLRPPARHSIAVAGRAGALVLPLILAFARRFRRIELPFYFAALAAAAATLITYTLTDFPTLYRFIFPTLFAIAAAVVGRGAAFRPKHHAAAALPWLLLLAFFIGADLLRPRNDRSGSYDHYSFLAMAAEDWNAWSNPKDSPALAAVSKAGEYAQAQQSVPPAAKIFVATTYPALFDFSRNPIFPIDMVGGASPDPGMPLLAGPDAVRTYLKNQGIDYLIFTNPDIDPAHLSLETWSKAREHPETQTPAFQRVYKFNLAAINDLESLAQTDPVPFTGASLRVIKLK